MQNIFIDVLPPWVETGLQPAFYDLESGTVLQQTARMYAKVRELNTAFNTFSENVTNEINQFESDVNDEIEKFEHDTNEAIAEFEHDVNETVNDYIDKFNALHDYVEDYFENLDVQEEINNKLDDMLEQGTLQEIITTYIQSNVSWLFDTVADMKLATNLINGSYARTLGFHAVGDGGGANYTITDTGTANEMDCIAIGSTLYANLVKSGDMTPEMFGAYGDDTHDDTASVKRALSQVGELYCESTYKLTDILGNYTNVNIYGNNKGCFKFTDQTTDGEFALNLQGTFELNGMKFIKNFEGTVNNPCGIEVSNSNHAVVSNCTFDYIGHINGYFDVYTNNQNLYVSNCYFKADTTVGGALTIGCVNIREQGGEDSENITFDNCTFDSNSNDEMLSIRTGDTGNSMTNVRIQNCTFKSYTNATNAYMITGKNSKDVVYDNCVFYKPASTYSSQYIFAEVEGSSYWKTDDRFRTIFNNCKFIISGAIKNIIYSGENYVPVAKMYGCTIDAYETSIGGFECHNTKINVERMQTAAYSSLWSYDSEINVDTALAQLSTAVLELHNTTLNIAQKTDNYNLYQPTYQAHLVIENSHLNLIVGLIYMGSSVNLSNPTFRLANNIIKAARGNFANPVQSLVNSYIINNTWLGFTPTIESDYITSNNTVVSLS